MSDLLAAAAEALGAPADLVQRSAAARAQATGSSVDQVLASWTGGAPVAASAPPEPAPAPVADPPAPVSEAVPAPSPEAVVATPVVAAVAVAQEEAHVEPPVEPAPLTDRVKTGAKSGALVGGVMALLSILFSIQWLLPRASVTGSEGDFSPAVEVVPGWLVLGSALLGVVAGMVIAGSSRLVSTWRGPTMSLTGTGRSSLAGGGVMGGLVGLVLGALLAGLTEPLGDGLGLLPVGPALGWTIGAWVVGGWLVGIIVQALATPHAEAHPDVEEVRSRLGSAYGIPVAAILAVVVLAGPAAYVFLLFPSWAPVLGMFIAASILGFAGLAASRPGMRISAGEFLIAAAGIAVVVIIVASILNAQGAGHAEEPHSETRAPVTALL